MGNEKCLYRKSSKRFGRIKGMVYLCKSIKAKEYEIPHRNTEF